MICGTGVDIAETSRLERSLERHGERFTKRVFTPAEIAYCDRFKNRAERYAARFAAKEAAFTQSLLHRNFNFRNFGFKPHPCGDFREATG